MKEKKCNNDFKGWLDEFHLKMNEFGRNWLRVAVGRAGHGWDPTDPILSLLPPFPSFPFSDWPETLLSSLHSSVSLSGALLKLFLILWLGSFAQSFLFFFSFYQPLTHRQINFTNTIFFFPSMPSISNSF